VQYYLECPEPKGKAAGWKRALIIALGFILIIASLGFALLLSPTGLFSFFCKWALVLFLGPGGIWFLIIGFRGDRRQVDKALDDASGAI
jgi:hypothetical protein